MAGAVWCAAVTSGGVSAEAASVNAATQTPAAHLRVDDTVGDVLAHPTFAGFARLLLPWDDRRYDAAMRLREIGSLLPYHTHVDPGVVVSSINRMIDDAAAGRPVFHDFYTAAEKEAGWVSVPAPRDGSPTPFASGRSTSIGLPRGGSNLQAFANEIATGPSAFLQGRVHLLHEHHHPHT